MANHLSDLVLALLPVVAAAVVGGMATRSSIATWYARLKKPSFNPPNAIFAPVWSILYASMVYAFYRVLAAPSSSGGAISSFLFQLALNAAWSIVFFRLRWISGALFVITALLVGIAVCIVIFWQVDRLASVLLVPYFLWVCFASVLNVSIWKLNRPLQRK
ncbi:MAG: tryptophan-rich sensory protein [Mesorhizobium sp.]|nr:tryptophan-rich sensory protein [Mesorhizobium sp.]